MGHYRYQNAKAALIFSRQRQSKLLLSQFYAALAVLYVLVETKREFCTFPAVLTEKQQG